MRTGAPWNGERINTACAGAHRRAEPVIAGPSPLWHSKASQEARAAWGDIVGQEIWTAIAGEFSDVPDVTTLTVISVRLLFAAMLGGILGYERERRGRSAGVRTHMLVAVGAALFVLGPMMAGMEIGDLSRVIQGVVQGIGFLGAGAIIFRRSRHAVEGLTTAANIWATAAIGIIAGLGLEGMAVLSTAVALVILAVVPRLLPKDIGEEEDAGEERA